MKENLYASDEKIQEKKMKHNHPRKTDYDCRIVFIQFTVLVLNWLAIIDHEITVKILN